MIDNNTVLRLGDKRIFPRGRPGLDMVHAILKEETEMLKFATPVVMERLGPEEGVVHAFSLLNNLQEDIITPATNLAVVPLKPLVRTHRTVRIERFEPKKTLKLLEYVKANNGITFFIVEKTPRLQMFSAIAAMRPFFKYNLVIGWKEFEASLRSTKDIVLGVVSIFDIKYCLPIFNGKRIDGLGVSYCQATLENSVRGHQLARTFRFDFVLSNLKDNIFVADGTTINGPNPLNGSYVEHFTKLAARKIPIIESSKAKSGARKEKSSLQKLYDRKAAHTITGRTKTVKSKTIEVQPSSWSSWEIDSSSGTSGYDYNTSGTVSFGNIKRR